METLREAGRVATAVLMATAMLAGVSRASIRNAGAFNAGGVQEQERTCSPAAAPKQLPDVAALFDLEGLRREIAREGAMGPADGEMIFSVRFAADGQREWLQQIGTDPNAPPSRVQRLAVTHLLPQAPGREPWSVRLHVTSGDSLQFRVARSEACPVQRIERAIPPSLGPMSSQDFAELRRAGRYRVGVNVSATGVVLSVEMLQRSGSRMVDDSALNVARRSKYRPALVDGIPVAARYEEESRTRVRSG